MIGLALMIIGGIISIIGSIGLVRFPDVYSRSHGQTVVCVGGTCLILFGAILDQLDLLFSIRMIFLIIFIFMTSPVGTHAITKSAYLSGVKPTVKRDEWKSKTKSSGAVSKDDLKLKEKSSSASPVERGKK